MHTIVHGIEVEKIEKGRIAVQKDQGMAFILPT
jgi:hypothetical protein